MKSKKIMKSQSRSLFHGVSAIIGLALLISGSSALAQQAESQVLTRQPRARNSSDQWNLWLRGAQSRSVARLPWRFPYPWRSFSFSSGWIETKI
jgi:hypothetical protein